MSLGSNTQLNLMCILRLLFVLGLFCIPCKSGIEDSFGCGCCEKGMWQSYGVLEIFENNINREIDVMDKFLMAPYKKRLKL